MGGQHEAKSIRYFGDLGSHKVGLVFFNGGQIVWLSLDDSDRLDCLCWVH